MSPALLDERALLALTREQLLPHLLQQHQQPSAPVRVWSIGAQAEDEALLLLLRLVSAQGAPASPVRFTLYATDPDLVAVSAARRLASSDRLETHPSLAPYHHLLEAGRNGLSLPGTLRESLIFGPHDLTGQVPFPHLALIVCALPLARYPAAQQDELLHRLAYALLPYGLLLLLAPDTVRPDDRLYALYLLAFTTGMREDELLGLSWRHVHLKEGTVTIVQAAQRQRSSDPASALKTQIVFSEVKTGNSKRTIRLYSRVVEALKAHRTRQKVERLEAGRYWMDRDLVFCTLFGDFLRPEEVWRYFKKHLKEAGLPARRFHDIRHTAITLMLEQEVNPLLVSAIAGHHSKEFTMSVYGHVTPQMEKQGHERMEAFFGEAQ